MFSFVQEQALQILKQSSLLNDLHKLGSFFIASVDSSFWLDS